GSISQNSVGFGKASRYNIFYTNVDATANLFADTFYQNGRKSIRNGKVSKIGSRANYHDMGFIHWSFGTSRLI
ncbi:MAG: hypothetical protein LBH26_00945, partial [Treponema sp.]|nr:hypothetical protein [Treponema sp.]